QGAGPSDNRNAVLLVEFSDQPVQALANITLEEFYESSVSRIAQGSATESAIAEGFVSFRESLLGQRAQFSGVSLDEEAIKILEFQHSFQASARLISTIDELFTTLLNM
ncbi:MAG: flagellar hook-associated protein FlgK, partial [Planctomycetes bacterium]|nr:flagellar hook-associated protein FlgK [Planctomycetota bacterium]